MKRCAYALKGQARGFHSGSLVRFGSSQSIGASTSPKRATASPHVTVERATTRTHTSSPRSEKLRLLERG